MEPRIIVVQSNRCHQELVFGSLGLALNLPSSFFFKKPTLVRLHSAAGLGEEVSVTVSFAERVPSGDSFRRQLGVVAPGSLPGPWNRVDGGFINSQTSLTLTKISGEPYTSLPEKPFVLVLELTSQHGGPCGYPGF